VSIGEGSSVWYGAIVKGDSGTIKVGNNTSIQDRVELDSACVIGSGVTIAPSALLTKATVGDDCFIGSGSKLVDGAKVEANSIVAPGAVVGSGKVVGSGQYWAGNPAVHVRDLSAEEIEGIRSIALENFELAFIHDDQASKSFEQIEEEKEIHKVELERDPNQSFHPNPDLKLARKGLIYDQKEME
jgi:carbonic anhydrase/acetyltransferase-like protein (isoleucine patch superfamily)